MVCSLPGSSVHGILQARVLKWVAIPFSKGSSPPRDRTWVSCIAGDTLPCTHLYHPKQELKHFHHPWKFHLSCYAFILSFHPQAITFQFLSVCSLITKSRPTVLWPHGLQSVCPGDPLSMGFPRQEYWIGCHFLLQGIFPAQGSNLGLLHCRRILYHLNHQLSPIIY